MKIADREAFKDWQSYYREFSRGRDIDYFESAVAKHKRIDRLLGNFFEFAKYYFPAVCKAEFATWHKKYVSYVVENDQCYAVIKVSRDMAKSSVTAMLIVYLYFKGEFKTLGYFSHIQDQAENLLKPVRLAFEKNLALIRDFGLQQGSPWTNTRFTTVKGVSFRAIGAGQNPRGEKGEDADRFDIEIFDDFDDPEVCRNAERLDNNWKYVEGDCYPAMHTSGKRRIIHLNNKIDEDCIIERAWNKAAKLKNPLRITVNLVDRNGKSNWPQAFTDEECKEMITLSGDEADTEYFNNPVKKGKLFQKDWFTFKELPRLSFYKYLVAYLDGGFKKTKTSDTKALVLMGAMNGELHVRKVYVDNVSIGTMIDWHYDLKRYLDEHQATAQWWMEEVFLLGLLHDHFDESAKTRGFRIPILGDKRQKPDKDLRIGNTAGYFERGNIVFDISMKDDRFTERLIRQYLRFRVGLSNIEKDGPDAMEGAIFKLHEMMASGNSTIAMEKRPRNKYKI